MRSGVSLNGRVYVHLHVPSLNVCLEQTIYWRGRTWMQERPACVASFHGHSISHNRERGPMMQRCKRRCHREVALNLTLNETHHCTRIYAYVVIKRTPCVYTPVVKAGECLVENVSPSSNQTGDDKKGSHTRRTYAVLIRCTLDRVSSSDYD